MRFQALSLLILAMVAGCTTTSTVGENPDDKTSPGKGDPSDPSKPAPSPSPTTPTPTPTPPPLDKKGVASAAVTARFYMGGVNPITGVQESGTSIQIRLRSQDVAEPAWPTGAPGTCISKPNSPSLPPDYDLNLPVTLTVTAAGKSKTTTYDTQYKHASAQFLPPLPDGTPITLTFGPEVPALAGKSITMPAVTTSLAAPARKPYAGVREYRAYEQGTDFTMQWAAVSGKKFFLSADSNGGASPSTVVNCFLDDSATTLTVPASTMATVSSGDPTNEFPIVFLLSKIESTDAINGIQIHKSSVADVFFQLNMNP
jgi:hypothetical protein